MILDGSVWHCSILKFYGHNSKKYRVIVPKPTASIGWSKFYIQGTFYIPGTFYISRMAGNKIDDIYIYICTWITGMMYITKIDTIQHINTMHTDIYIYYTIWRKHWHGRSVMVCVPGSTYSHWWGHKPDPRTPLTERTIIDVHADHQTGCIPAQAGWKHGRHLLKTRTGCKHLTQLIYL